MERWNGCVVAGNQLSSTPCTFEQYRLLRMVVVLCVAFCSIWSKSESFTIEQVVQGKRGILVLVTLQRYFIGFDSIEGTQSHSAQSKPIPFWWSHSTTIPFKWDSCLSNIDVLNRLKYRLCYTEMRCYKIIIPFRVKHDSIFAQWWIEKQFFCTLFPIPSHRWFNHHFIIPSDSGTHTLNQPCTNLLICLPSRSYIACLQFFAFTFYIND